MASAEVELKQTAISIANDIQGRGLAHKRELEEIELRAAELKLQIESASRARERSRTFSPSIAGNYQCPFCWVQSEQKANLVTVASEDENDNFVCRHCGNDFAFAP